MVAKGQKIKCTGLFIMCRESDDEGARQSPQPDAKAEEEDVEFDAIFKGQKNEKRCFLHKESWCLVQKCVQRPPSMARISSLEGKAVSCSESEDDGDRQGPRPDDEAEEEDDDFEAIFKGQKNRKRRGSHAESVAKGVEDLLAHMEVAAEKDMEAIKDGRPAFMKLKMLKEVIGSTTIIALIITASSSHQQHQRVHGASYAYTITMSAAERGMIAISVDWPALMTLILVERVSLPALTAICTQKMAAQGWPACFHEAQDAQGGWHMRLSGGLCAPLRALTACCNVDVSKE